MQERGEEPMKEAAGAHAENTASFSLKLRPLSVHASIRGGKVVMFPKNFPSVWFIFVKEMCFTEIRKKQKTYCPK